MLRRNFIFAFVLLAIGLTVVQAQNSEIIAQGNNFDEKMQWLKAFAKNGTKDKYIVEFNADESFGQLDLSSYKRDITVIFRGIGANRTLKVSRITVDRDVELILDNNITIRPSGSRDQLSSLITVREDGWLVMNDGSTITGVSFSGNGGAVLVNKGTFTMNGGTITGNTSGWGGAVYVEGSGYVQGDFIMKGGTITGNNAREGGGVYVADNGRFNMKGGTISGNTAEDKGGGVYVDIGIFTKTGGTITGYTSDQSNGNVVKNNSGVRNFNGHAVYAYYAGPKIMDKTAGEEDNMSYADKKASGTWDN